MVIHRQLIVNSLLPADEKEGNESIRALQRTISIGLVVLNKLPPNFFFLQALIAFLCQVLEFVNLMLRR